MDIEKYGLSRLLRTFVTGRQGRLSEQTIQNSKQTYKMATGADIVHARILNAFNLSLRYRCEEISQIISDSNNKDLQAALPQLIEHIFGLKDQIGWGIRSIYMKTQPSEFQLLLHFLGPSGSMLTLCYKLMTDCYLKYEFPLHFLPMNIRKMIEEGIIPPFYTDKIKIDQQTRLPTALLLNPFELYMFHFAYHLVNPWLQRLSHGSMMWETVYIFLSEEFLTHFLPCESSNVVPHVNVYVPKTTLPLQAATRPVRSPTLFRQSVILTQSSSPTSLHSTTSTPQPSSMVEVWRSETVVQVFLDFWLSHGEKEVVFATPQRELLPTTERIRVVRNLIKHLHYFSNSAGNEMTAMDELKRIVLPSSQFKIYSFLRYTMHHWPLDSSFRLILEAWLSYIQPWRYTNCRDRSTDQEQKVVDRHWQNFIAENLLAYTVIFQQLLPRFARLDLTAPRNAQMLYRVTKVFGQPNLNTMLAEVESCLEEPRVRPAGCDPGAGHKWAVVVRQQLVELEGPGYTYCPMFGREMTQKVAQFLSLLQQVLNTAQSLQQAAEEEASRQSFNFLSLIRGAFSSSLTEAGEYSLDERRKVTAYLETCIQKLASLYQIDLSRLAETCGENEFAHYSPPSYLQTSLGSLSDSSDAGSPSRSPPGRPPRRRVRYEGDPDLEPIRSSEIAFLVRILYQLAAKLNEMYSVEMCNLYHRQDLWGRVARQVLYGPQVVRSYDKSCPGAHSPLVRSVLPPRLSLRRLARRSIVSTFFGGMFFAWYFGYADPVAYVLAVVLLVSLYILVRALFEHLFGSDPPNRLALDETMDD